MEMTSLDPAVTQGPLGRTSMPCGSRVNGIAAGLLIKHTGGTHYATHTHTHTRTHSNTSKPAYSTTHSQRHTYTKTPHTAIIIKGRQTQKTHTLTHTLSLKVPHLPQDLSVQVCPTSFCLAGFTTHSIQRLHQCT